MIDIANKSNKKSILHKHRVIADLNDENGKLYFRLGKANFNKAGVPVEEHIHKDMVEIVLMIKGSQVYTVNNKEYTVNSGEAFITLPNELHSSGSYPEDKSLIYYIIINLENEKLSLGYDDIDIKRICDIIYGINNRVFKINTGIGEFCECIINEYYSENSLKNTNLRNQISNLILNITDCILNNLTNYTKSDFWYILEYIDTHINEDISVTKLSRIANLSVSRFKTKFRQEVGIPPKEYFLRQKVDLAKEMLLSTEDSITDISFNLGFMSSQYFSTVFKRYTSITPTNYRKNNINHL